MLPAVVQFVALKLTLVNPVQTLKALYPIEVTLLGIVIDVILLHPLNAKFPIEVTVLGMVIDVRFLQLANVDEPIDVMEFGMVMYDRPLHP